MATHFVRWTIDPGYPFSLRLNEENLHFAHSLSPHRQRRFLASRALLGELIFMLYGIKQLPQIVTTTAGRPCFSDRTLTDFSIAYAGNSVGVAITTEGRCGLGMELHPFGSVPVTSVDTTFSNNEAIWINNQHDPDEARSQLRTLRQSVFKLTGNDDELQLIPGAGRLRMKHQTQIEAISDAEDILVWACAVSPAVEKLSLWEFNHHEGWCNLKGMQARRSDPNGRIIRFSNSPYEKHSLQTDHS